MTKQANILNKYELKAIAMSKQFDCNKFYKYELGNMIDILKEENKSLRDTIEKIKKRLQEMKSSER